MRLFDLVELTGVVRFLYCSGRVGGSTLDFCVFFGPLRRLRDLPVLYFACVLLWKNRLLVAIHDPCGKSHCAKQHRKSLGMVSDMWKSND
jgi:hypothetical protein